MLTARNAISWKPSRHRSGYSLCTVRMTAARLVGFGAWCAPSSRQAADVGRERVANRVGIALEYHPRSREDRAVVSTEAPSQALRVPSAGRGATVGTGTECWRIGRDDGPTDRGPDCRALCGVRRARAP